MFEINVWNNLEMYGEKKIRSQNYKRYTKKALDALREVISKSSEDEIWEKHKAKVLNR